MLEVRNISAGYGNKTVIKDLTASFEKGKITSITGTNGCGKSTLLKTLVGIISISDGEILYDGINISTMKRNKIAQRSAYLSQGKNTPDMTVMQMVLHGRFPYLSYPRRYSKQDYKIASDALEKVGMINRSDTPLYNLSGGMKQNAYIAMALAQDTDYILLDEPTTYLDISHQIKLMETLKHLASAGKGIITVMHDLPLAFRYSDKIAVISDKKITVFGNPCEIYNSDIIEKTFEIRLKYNGNNEYYYDY